MDSTLQFLVTLARLKKTPRTGWLNRGIPPADVESVADHVGMTALIAWTLALDEPDIDADRVLQLAIVHDLAEAITGDTPPYAQGDIPDPADRAAFEAFFRVRRIASEEALQAKHRAEADAARHMLGMLSGSAAATLTARWEEYESRDTPEALFVKDVDRLEAFLQSLRYRETHPDAPVDGFADMARLAITHPRLCQIRDDALIAAGLPLMTDD